MVKLSILIPTTLSREPVFRGLLRNLTHQAKKYIGEVEILINRNEEDNVGKKRNDLLKQAGGEYVVFVDSDDLVSRDYVQLLLNAAKKGSDCIGISGVITTNGKKPMQWHISLDYKKWFKKGRTYFRTPNHISPVKREIALKVMFPEVTFGEDAVYSEGIYPLLKTETKVPGNIYHYQYSTK